jgi:hypothetical protein
MDIFRDRLDRFTLAFVTLQQQPSPRTNFDERTI